MRLGKDCALDERVIVAPAQAEGEPVTNSVGDGVAIGPDDETVLIVTDDLPQLALRLSLGPAPASLDDPLTARRVPDRQRCDPAIAGGIPGKAAITAAVSACLQATRDSRSRSAT